MGYHSLLGKRQVDIKARKALGSGKIMFVREYLLPLIENIYIVKITFVGTGTQFSFLAGPSMKDLEN